MKIHVLKSWPQYFEALLKGTRTHELRRNDRNFEINDVLELHEFDPATQDYTGRTYRYLVTSLTQKNAVCAVSDQALHPDFCILSVRTHNVHAFTDF